MPPMRTLLRTRTVAPSPALLWLSALACAPAGFAQDAPRSDPPTAPALPALTSNVGMHEVDGELWAVGASYKARFDAAGVLIVPDLGAQAPRSLPLRLGPARALRAGSSAPESSSPSAPTQRGMTAVYERGPAFEERYEARAEGLEQSFLLRELPAGDGDLVLRFDYATELAPRAAGAGLEFDDERGRGLAFGGVTAIDADGRSVAGRVELTGDAIELVVPSEFVANARLPLLVDPLIGGKSDVYTAATASNTDASYDATTDTFLVVFQRDWSSTDHDIYGQRVTPSGAPVGNLIQFETTVENVAEVPAVGNCNGTDRWFVAWRNILTPGSNANIVGRSCKSTTASIDALLTIAATALYEDSPDVGGESEPQYSRVAVVWTRDGVRAAWIELPSVGNASIASTTTLSTGINDFNCRISNSGGYDGLYAVVFERLSISPVVQRDVYVAFPNWLGQVVVAAQPVTSSTGADERWPQVDGNGASFAVVYATWPNDSSPTRDLACRKLSFTGWTLVVGPETLVDDSNGVVVEPLLAYTGTGYVAGWRTSQNPIRLVGLDALDASVCELPYALSTGIANGGDLAPQYAAGGASDDALATFSDGSIRAQALEYLTGGSVANLGGGCGTGGAASLQCAPKVGSNLRHTLTGAPPSAFAFLLLSPERADLACGSCKVAPSPYSSFVIPFLTTGAGAASFSTPIAAGASVAGLVFYEQWAVLPGAGGSCGPLGASMSNAIQVTFQ